MLICIRDRFMFVKKFETYEGKTLVVCLIFCLDQANGAKLSVLCALLKLLSLF